jgi:hypothetical protein
MSNMTAREVRFLRCRRRANAPMWWSSDDVGHMEVDATGTETRPKVTQTVPRTKQGWRFDPRKREETRRALAKRRKR